MAVPTTSPRARRLPDLRLPRRLQEASWFRPRDWYLPLVVLIALAVLIRLLIMVGYPTESYSFNDSLRFVRIPGYGHTGLFGDTWMPAGYPAFLIVVRAITNWLPFTIALQHVLGLATGLLMYGAVRRSGAPRWLALIPAAVVLLAADQLWLEHIILAEGLLTFFIAAGLYAAARSSSSPARAGWLLASGTLMALAALTKSVGLVLPVVVALWAVFVTPGRWRPRLRSGALVIGPAAVLIVAYLITASLSNGWAGLTDMADWNLYGRVAQFADCTKFTPPPGTRQFCESTPPGLRHGPFWYIWNPQSHARLLTGQRIEPGNSGAPGRFARAAILGQPFDYLRAVGKDLVRFIDPTVGYNRPDSGNDVLDFTYVPNAYSQNIQTELRTKYSGVSQNTSLVSFFEAYQNIFTLGGLGMTLLVVTSLAGLLFGRGPARRAAVLFGACALAIYLGSVATWSYDVRYGVPVLGSLAACAALGALALFNRRVPQAA